jgi:hypothetical protein
MKIELEKRYGFKEPVHSAQDFRVGGLISLPKIVRNPSGDWTNFLPTFERQHGSGWDSYSCTVYGALNAYEALIKLLENVEYNFSERYNANLIEIEPPGADPKEAAQSIHKDGVVLQVDLPFVDNEKEFKSPRPMTEEFKAIGRTWLGKYDFQYEFVFENNSNRTTKLELMKEYLKYGTLCVSVEAWTQNDKGEYISTGRGNNHWVMLVKIDEQNRPVIFDSYENDIKTLSANHDIRYCMRYHLTTLKEVGERLSLAAKMVALLNDLLNLFKKKKEIEPPQPLPVKEPTMQEKFLKVCLDALDEEVTPKDEVPDNVACAQTLSTLLKKVLPDFPIIASTKDLDAKLYMDKRFKRITEPKRGCIVISPRTQSTNGHTGTFITSERIASNDSKTGKWVGNYSWQGWIKEFRDRRGLKIYLYELST